jgi:hypothetical protein
VGCAGSTIEVRERLRIARLGIARCAVLFGLLPGKLSIARYAVLFGSRAAEGDVLQLDAHHRDW